MNTLRSLAGTLVTSLPFLWILVPALLVLALLGWCHSPAQPAIPPKVQQEIDALKSTNARDHYVIDSLKRTSGGDVATANSQAAKSTAARQSADRSQAKADQLAIAARQARTADAQAAEWKAAYDARTEEADTLRKALAFADSAGAARERARQAIDSALALSELRRTKAEQLNADLEKTIANQAKGCRVAFVIPCVSRGVAFTAGAIVGGAAGVYLARR